MGKRGTAGIGIKLIRCTVSNLRGRNPTLRILKVVVSNSSLEGDVLGDLPVETSLRSIKIFVVTRVLRLGGGGVIQVCIIDGEESCADKGSESLENFIASLGGYSVKADVIGPHDGGGSKERVVKTPEGNGRESIRI